jgi:hypothetical protein
MATTNNTIAPQLAIDSTRASFSVTLNLVLSRKNIFPANTINKTAIDPKI